MYNIKCNTTTTTTKTTTNTVVYRRPPVAVARPNYNAYKAQYYN